MIDYENLRNSNSFFESELEEACKRVVKSGRYILGQEVESFEFEFAHSIGVKHCVAVNSGLDALVLTFDALTLPHGSEVLVPANTYIALF